MIPVNIGPEKNMENVKMIYEKRKRKKQSHKCRISIKV